MQSIGGQPESGTDDADGRHRDAAVIDDRRRRRAGTGGIDTLHVVAASARKLERRFERRAHGRGETVQQAAGGDGLEPRGDGAAQRTGVPRRALAHVGGQPDRLASGRRIADHARVVVENAEQHRFVGGVADRREFRRGGGAQVELGPHAVREFEQPVAEPPGPIDRIAAQETATFERGQEPVQRRARQRGAPLQIHERDGRRRRGDEIEDVHRLVEHGSAGDRLGRARGSGRPHPFAGPLRSASLPGPRASHLTFSTSRPTLFPNNSIAFPLCGNAEEPHVRRKPRPRRRLSDPGHALSHRRIGGRGGPVSPRRLHRRRGCGRSRLSGCGERVRDARK